MSKNNILLGSGLSALGFLEKNKLQTFIVYDKNNYVGGHAYSHIIDGYYFDEGAHISHSRNKFFLDYLGTEKLNKANTFKSNICNFKNNKKIGYPIQFYLSDLDITDKIKILKDAFTISQNKINNYNDWLLDNFGKHLTDNYYMPYTKKYWRCKPSEMSSNWVSGRLPKRDIFKTISSIFFNSYKNKMAYDTFRYPKDEGFFNFFKDKYSKFDVNLNSKITKIDLNRKSIIINNQKEVFFNKLISSIPLVDYLDLIPDLKIQIKNDISQLKYTKLYSYNFKIKKKEKIDFHWCYFYDEKIDVSRMSILNNFNQNDNIDEYYLIQMEVFRRNDEKVDTLGMDQNVKDHLLDFFKIKENQIFFEKKIVIEKAYPIPLINTEKIRLKIIDYLKENDIYQIGLYGKWKYMWSDQSFLDGFNLEL
tara:strand:- start:1059 stop:2318 length:1260 start_codon:yes stop_codon:yes gene_type:complete